MQEKWIIQLKSLGIKLALSTYFVFTFLICNGQKGKDGFSNRLMDTATCGHIRLVRIFNNDMLTGLVTLAGDTILRHAEYYRQLQFIDINADGYTDIRVFVFSNTPNQCENYFFDSRSNSFRFIQDCDLDIRLVPGTSYYYSYNSAGCADNNWESHLSRIEDFKLVAVGYIHGQGCENTIDASVQQIKIFRVLKPGTEQMELLNTLSYQQYISKAKSKWNFIEDYWRKNWKLFAN